MHAFEDLLSILQCRSSRIDLERSVCYDLGVMPSSTLVPLFLTLVLCHYRYGHLASRTPRRLLIGVVKQQ